MSPARKRRHGGARPPRRCRRPRGRGCARRSTVGTSPFRMCRSVPQIVDVVIRTTASVGSATRGSWLLLPGPPARARGRRAPSSGPSPESAGEESEALHSVSRIHLLVGKDGPSRSSSSLPEEEQVACQAQARGTPASHGVPRSGGRKACGLRPWLSAGLAALAEAPVRLPATLAKARELLCFRVNGIKLERERRARRAKRSR